MIICLKIKQYGVEMVRKSNLKLIINLIHLIILLIYLKKKKVSDTISSYKAQVDHERSRISKPKDHLT